MLFIIISLLLFAGIVFFQALQGTFSALIMVVLTTISAAVAVNYYAPLSQAYLIAHIPNYADSACLAGLFFIILVTLRSLADNFVRGNIVTYNLPDRFLAGLISIPTALIIVGIASISFEMLPFGEQVMLFNRYSYNTDEPSVLKRNGIFPFADEFAAGFIAKLSDGALSKSQSFAKPHPDWPGEVSAQRIALQRESTHAVAPGLIKIVRAWRLKMPLLIKKYPDPVRDRWGRSSREKVRVISKYKPSEDNYFLAVRLTIDPKAADGDGYNRFSWGQIRIVGFKGLSKKITVNYYAIGLRDQHTPAEFDYMRVKVPLPLPENDDTAPVQYRNFGYVSPEKVTGPEDVDVVFELPEDFTPWFVEYKRWSRALVPKISAGEEGNEDIAEPAAESGESPSVGKTARAGWRAEFRIDPNATKFASDIPWQLKSKPAARQFTIPSDKRLLIVDCELNNAKTRLLQSIFNPVQNIAQKMVIDTNGNHYFPIAEYVMGSGITEFAYDQSYADADRVPPLKTPVSQLANKNLHIGFLFFVNPGDKLDRFEIGGTPIEAQTLELTAPQ